MAITTRRYLQFSLSSLLLLAALVGLTIVAARSTRQVLRLQVESTAAKQQIEALQSAAELWRHKTEREFFGIHDEPILAVELRGPSDQTNLYLFRILNSKGFGQSGNIGPRTVQSAFLGPIDRRSSEDEETARRAGFDLRLLRSLDGKDYYRLVYNPTSQLIRGKPGDPNYEAQETLLFEYDGEPQVLVDTALLVMAIAKDRESSIEALLSTHEPEEAEQLRSKWRRQPAVHTLFHPAVRTYAAQAK